MTNMLIHSRHLRNALNAVVGFYPGENFTSDSVSIPAPYHVLIHHRRELADYKTAQPSCHDAEDVATTAEHIDVLLEFLDKTYGAKIQEEVVRHRNDPPTATFEWYWLLLKPGEVAYCRVNNVWRPFVIEKVVTVGIFSRGTRLTNYVINYWNISHGRGKLRRCHSSVRVNAFSGEQAIHRFALVPEAFLPEDLNRQGGLTMAERQIQLGRTYWDLVKKPAYKEYEGNMISRDNCMIGKISGRVIVDVAGYNQYGIQIYEPHTRPPPPPPPPPPSTTIDPLPEFAARCCCKACSREGDRKEAGPLAGFDDLDPSEDEPPKNDLYFISCTDMVPAFVLGERRWGYIYIDGLKEVKSDGEAFKHLILDDEIKLTVRALIGKFASADGKVSPWPRDIVKNKGEGRIFLLHGPPGVGKTCTAECVAELTRRPLLALTSGDISSGAGAGAVERSLRHFLALGERYGALVLLDEADVYLEARRARDLRRNGLVSVFLRALEYYRGVLFLTTNRVEAFDAAFASRIHVALRYRALSQADRARVWAAGFDRLERDSAGRCRVGRAAREYAAAAAGEVRALRWNGREIRNALQTAVGLAEAEALEDGLATVAVTEEHLRAVARMSKGFKDFLRGRRARADDPRAGGGDEDDEEEEGHDRSDASDIDD